MSVDGVIEQVARAMHEESWKYGERRLTWDEEPLDVRSTFRASAIRVIGIVRAFDRAERAVREAARLRQALQS